LTETKYIKLFDSFVLCYFIHLTESTKIILRVSYDESIFNWKINHEMISRRINRHLIAIISKSRILKTVFDHHHISTRRRTKAFIFDYIDINTSISLSFLLWDVVQIKAMRARFDDNEYDTFNKFESHDRSLRWQKMNSRNERLLTIALSIF
jgi:hypothetical protein